MDRIPQRGDRVRHILSGQCGRVVRVMVEVVIDGSTPRPIPYHIENLEPEGNTMKKLFILEDEAIVLKSLVRFLRGKFQIETASSVHGVVEKIQNFSPDVVLLDRDVDGEIGWMVRKVLNPRVGVVLMTGDVYAECDVPFFKKGNQPTSELLPMLEQACHRDSPSVSPPHG